jgi:alpha-1,3-glucosyltransferase
MFWYALALAIRILLFWGYRSTDFEVHRNWKAITYSLPLDSWYYENTSQSTLDYPPFFAYFEYTLSQIAAKVDSDIVKISENAYASEKCIFFMRCSVMLSEIVLVVSLWLIGNKLISLLILLNPGLIYIDRIFYTDIHFQYNGMLLGLTLLSIYLVNSQAYLKAAVSFTILLLFKHVYLYYVNLIQAPAFFFFFLKHYCWDNNKFSLKRLVVLGSTVLFILFVGLFPFIPHLTALKNRLFPWGRGLTHSYWAPNFWAIYNFLDVVANFFLKKNVSSGYTKGFVQTTEHVALPNITPMITFLLLLIGICLLGIFICKSNKYQFCECLCLSGLIFFMLGWHVHEKAILMVSIPML